MCKIRAASKTNILDRAIMETLWFTGAKVQELCDLKLADVNLQDRYIKISKQKCLHKREVPFQPYYSGKLLGYLNVRKKLLVRNGGISPFLFLNKYGKSFTPQEIRNIICRYTKIAGINKKVTPNCFRRSFFSILFNHGISLETISIFLGHRSLSTTTSYIIYKDMPNPFFY